MSNTFYTSTDAIPLLSLGLKGFFFIVLIFFVLHAIFLAYHLFAYGNSRSVSIAALGIYLAGGAVLLATLAIALSSLHLL